MLKHAVVLLLLCLFCCLDTISGNAPPIPSQRGVVRYCAEVERFVKANRGGPRVFGAIRGTADEVPSGFEEWKEHESEEEWVKARDAGGGSGDVALVWLRNGKVVQANFTLGSSSGDWALFALYCFMPDATLGRLQSELNTFYGRMTVEREYFYDSKKESFQATLRYFDLDTNKPKRPNEEFYDHEPPLYRNTSNLPFAKLIESPGPSHD